jgi:hypothetical protein
MSEKERKAVESMILLDDFGSLAAAGLSLA